MKKRIHIVSIDTPPIENNPYLLFLIDTLINYYDISYWGLRKSKRYYNITMFHIYTIRCRILVKILKGVLYPFSFLFFIILKIKKRGKYHFNEIKRATEYMSITIANNVYLLFQLLFSTRHHDAFIAVNAGGLLALSWLKKIRNIRFCYCLYELYPFQNHINSRILLVCRCYFEKMGVKNCDFIIDAGENKISSFINKIYKVERIETKNLLVFPKATVQHSREKTTHPINFYYHGAYASNRGLEELIYAMKNIDVQKGHLYFRGIGSLREKLEELAKECGVSDKVFFLEPIETEKLSDAASDFDVGLTMVKMNCRNHRFAIGFKTFENMNAGLAIIAPASYNLTPMLDKYKVGIVYKDATIDELARVMNYCIENLEYLDKCKLASRSCVTNTIGRVFQEKKLVEIVELLFKPQSLK